MAASDVWERFVPLMNGPILPAEPYHLHRQLADRGFSLAKADATTLMVTPINKLTATDAASIRRWKWHLLMLIDSENASDALIAAACARGERRAPEVM